MGAGRDGQLPTARAGVCASGGGFSVARDVAGREGEGGWQRGWQVTAVGTRALG